MTDILLSRQIVLHSTEQPLRWRRRRKRLMERERRRWMSRR